MIKGLVGLPVIQTQIDLLPVHYFICMGLRSFKNYIIHEQGFGQILTTFMNIFCTFYPKVKDTKQYEHENCSAGLLRNFIYCARTLTYYLYLGTFNVRCIYPNPVDTYTALPQPTHLIQSVQFLNDPCNKTTIYNSFHQIGVRKTLLLMLSH